MPGSNNEHDRRPAAEQRAREIADQFPGMLDEGEQNQVAQRIERMFSAADEVRRYELDNGDEPAPIFRAIGKEQP
jgi:hypothetical protein